MNGCRPALCATGLDACLNTRLTLGLFSGLSGLSLGGSRGVAARSGAAGLSSGGAALRMVGLNARRDVQFAVGLFGGLSGLILGGGCGVAARS
jgi:hypothetical protein